jgi:diacylglycerol kinase (ATP)
MLLHPSLAPAKAKKLENIQYVTILYNPHSGNKRGEKVMQQTRARFQEQGLEVTAIQLQYPGHATEICKSRPDFSDVDVLCVVGGDGTFHEVVNGLMQNPVSRLAPGSLPALSVIPAGTGNSMVRELQGISSVKASADGVIGGTTVFIDVLKVTILSLASPLDKPAIPAYPKGEKHPNCDTALAEETEYLAHLAGGKRFVKKEVIYAFNSIHWGLASRILVRAEKMRWMGHGIRYTAASLMEMLSGTSTHARIILEDATGAITEYKDDTFCLLIANNIGTAGKGMKMAPKAKINDGLIDVLLIRSHKPWHLMRIFEKVYSGTHIDLPYVEYKQVRKFCIIPYKESGELETQADPELAEELVDIDGELKGCTPFECEVIPLALELIV